MESKKVRACSSLKLLGVHFDASEADRQERLADSMNTLKREADAIMPLPLNVAAREAAMAAITVQRLWYAPWNLILPSKTLIAARTHTLRALRPPLVRGPRLASVITGLVCHGHKVDPYLAPWWKLLCWIQLIDADRLVDLLAHIDSISDYPTGPIGTFLHYCKVMGVQICDLGCYSWR